MYSNKLAVAIKSNGKVLRETKDIVHLPFGSEFSVLVKNLESRRVKFRLSIDGTDTADGTDFIVNANSEVELKRFVKNGNMNEGNAFKFIERTNAIENSSRGIKVDDGVIRVEFWFEQPKPEITTTIHHHRDVWHTYPYYDPFRRHTFGGGYFGDAVGSSDVKMMSDTSSRGIMKGITANAANSAIPVASVAQATFSDKNEKEASIDSVLNDVGITVPGSKVEQKFTTVYGFIAESTSHVIVLRLVGKVGVKEVQEPVTVHKKNKCSTCDHVNKAKAKFCSECGTALELI